MEDPDLIGAGGQTVDPESPQRIGDESRLRALDDDISARQKSAIQTVDHHADDLGCSSLRWCWWLIFRLLCDERSVADGG
jgi:hypothetical protein